MMKSFRLIRLTRRRRHRAMIRLASRAISEEHGGEVLEYALIAGLIFVGAIATIACAGTKVLHRWTSIDSST